MGIINVLLSSIIFFFTIYWAVSLAIKPLLPDADDSQRDKQDLKVVGLVKLRDIEVIDNTELEGIVKFYQNRGIQKENYEEYKKYEKILNELREGRYLDDEDYLNKLEKLKSYFNVD